MYEGYTVRALAQSYVGDLDQLLLDHKLQRYLLLGQLLTTFSCIISIGSWAGKTIRAISATPRMTLLLALLDQLKIVHFDPFAGIRTRPDDLHDDIDEFEIIDVEERDFLFDTGEQAHALDQIVLLYLMESRKMIIIFGLFIVLIYNFQTRLTKLLPAL